MRLLFYFFSAVQHGNSAFLGCLVMFIKSSFHLKVFIMKVADCLKQKQLSSGSLVEYNNSCRKLRVIANVVNI